MRLVVQRTAPSIERVVHHHALLQHRLIVGEVGGQAERDREQPRGLRRNLGSRGIRTANDDRQPIERRLVQPVVVKEGIEAALFAVVRERLGARDVVGRGTGLLGDGKHLLGRHVDELGILGDEATDQPWTGDAVDLRRSRVTHLLGMLASPSDDGLMIYMKLEDTSVS